MVVCYADLPTSGKIVSACLGNIVHFCMFVYGNVTSAGWQVTLCDPVWHVSSRSGVATLRTAIHLFLVTYDRSRWQSALSSIALLVI